jgi:hypothetical protein
MELLSLEPSAPFASPRGGSSNSSDVPHGSSSPTWAEGSGQRIDKPDLPDIHGFMHVAMNGHWRSVVDEQLELMRTSGLYAKMSRLFVGLLGPDRSAFDLHDPKIEVVYYESDFTRFEFPTIQFLHQFCQSHDGLVFYLHTKGVFTNSPCTQDWRRYMQHFVIERHDECIRALAESDVCGVDWQQHPWPHFSGNFWWARCDYIRRLQDPAIPADGPVKLSNRHEAEFWIGTGAAVRAKCLFWSRTDLYQQRFPPSRYMATADAGTKPASADTPPQAPTAADGTEPIGTPTEADRTEVPLLPGGPSSSPPIYGFIHVAMTGHWKRVVADQLLKMRASGLWDKIETLFVGLLGPSSESFPDNDPKIRLMHLGEDFGPAERPTLAWLQAFCQNHDGLVFYLHTKGVFRQGIGQEEWRQCMEHFAIHRHEDCIAALADHDVCGINWSDAGWCRIFEGNFWWATARYIRTLPDIRSLPLLPGLDAAPRYICERWIGENPAVRVKCLHKDDVDHYRNEPYPRSRYARLREVPSHPTGRPSAWSGLENRFQDLLECVQPLQTIVEIGVEHGHSLFSFAAAAPSVTVIGVDPYGDLPEAETRRMGRLGSGAVIGDAAAFDWVRQHLRAFPNVVLLRTTGEQAARLIGNQIDVLHVDAVHTYDDVRSDFERWEPKIRPGGCVLFHDTVSYPNDVGRFFAELPGRKAEIRDCHGLGAWYKPVSRE